MTQSVSNTELLQDFLKRPNIESSPAWELLNNQALQKPMPSLFHSRLQRNLVNAINQALSDYEAIQEFRCIVPPFSPVPDISVVKASRLPNEDGPLQGAPDWLIEIRSPDQSTLELQNKILHCLSHGTTLAWLIDMKRQQIWVWQEQELPMIYAGSDQLPAIASELALDVDTVIGMTQR